MAEVLDQKVKIVENLLLTAAADRLLAGNFSWSEAIQTVLLSPVPVSQEQHLQNPVPGKPVELEAMPPQIAAPLHAARVAGAISLETPSALTGNQKQPDSTPVGGADSSSSAVVACGTAADVDVTAGGIASTAADAGATAACHIATATDDDGDATAQANQVVLGPDTSVADKEAAMGHLLPQARGFPVQTAPLDSQRVGKTQHDTTEQTDKSQPQPQQIKLTAAQLPATQPPPSHSPAVRHNHNLAPVPRHSSAASTR